MMNVESTKDKRVWHSGPPPFVGWWNASLPEYTSPFMWRWWDGERWSAGIVDNADPEGVRFQSQVPNPYDSNIVWNDYWPENAVCPRLNPGQSSTIWKGRMWAWIDGELISQSDPLPHQVEEFHRICQGLPELKTIVCPNHKFVDVEQIKGELHEVVTATAIAMGRMERIVNTVQSIRQQIGGA